MLVVGQPVLHQRREEQLPRELRHEHPYEDPGAGTNVVGPQPAELDLAFQIVFEEIEHPPRATLDEHLGDLRATDGLTDRRLQRSGSATARTTGTLEARTSRKRASLSEKYQ